MPIFLVHVMSLNSNYVETTVQEFEMILKTQFQIVEKGHNTSATYLTLYFR